MDKDIIQILWSALLIVIVTIVPLVKKFKEMQRKELRSASAAQPVRQAEADTSAPVSGFRKTAGKSPKTEKAESPLRNQIGISRADAEQQPHSPGIAEEFDVRKAVPLFGDNGSKIQGGVAKDRHIRSSASIPVFFGSRHDAK